MFVSWDPIPLTESRGFIINYTVTYQSQTMEQDALAVKIPGTLNSVVISNLQPSEQYTVTVSATTSAGEGSASDPVTRGPDLTSPSTGFPGEATAIIAVLASVILVMGVAIIIILGTTARRWGIDSG